MDLPDEMLEPRGGHANGLCRQAVAPGLELERGADLLPTLERYGRLAPFAAFIAENGGRDLPKMRAVG